MLTYYSACHGVASGRVTWLHLQRTVGGALGPAAGLSARVMCIWTSRTPVESVESHCKATHQVLALLHMLVTISF